MPAQHLQYRGIEELAFAAYFNKTSSLPSFVLEFLWANLLAAARDAALTCQEVLGQARVPGPHRRSALNNLIAC
jgi:hypothetical protein